MNSITSPELLSKVNPDNKELLEDFLNYLRAVQRSEGTIKQYRSDLNILMVWILQHAKNKDFKDITKRDVIAYQNWLIYDHGNSPARVRRLKSAMSSLSNYCENILSEDEPDYDNYRSIVRKIEDPPLVAAREKTVWSDEEIEGLLSRLMEMHEYEKACMLALAVYGGRRKAELCRFKVRDFDDDHLVCDGALYQSDPLLTKGNKMLNCFTLAKRFKPYLEAWMAERERRGIQSEWLFPSHTDPAECLPLTTMNSWANTFSAMTGRDFYWHSTRHKFCTACSQAGLPDGVIVEMIGWKDASLLRSTYLDLSKEEVLSAHFKNGDIFVQEETSLNDL